MGRIVRDYYPVDKLPADLRAGLTSAGVVRITIEEPDDGTVREGDPDALGKQSASTLELLFSSRPSNFSSIEEVDAHVRAMRDAWD